MRIRVKTTFCQRKAPSDAFERVYISTLWFPHPPIHAVRGGQRIGEWKCRKRWRDDCSRIGSRASLTLNRAARNRGHWSSQGCQPCSSFAAAMLGRSCTRLPAPRFGGCLRKK